MFSKPYINKMLQRTSAETLPMQLNSVRYIEPYKGSLNPQDLLELYVGNTTSYREINKALRLPNIQAAKQQVWDEAGLMKDKITYPELPKQYVLRMNSAKPNKITSDSIQAVDDASYILENYNPEELQKSGLYFNNHPLAYTEGFNQLPVRTQAQQVINYKIPEPTIVKPSIEDRHNAQDYLNQTLASIPHIEQALKQQPTFNPKAIGKEQVHKDVYGYLNDMGLGLYKKDSSINQALTEYTSGVGNANKVFDLVTEQMKGSPFSMMFKPDHLKNLLQSPDYSLSRGLHFSNPDDYTKFLSQHQPGAIVDYPAFTSTTVAPEITDKFSQTRNGEIPVIMNFNDSQTMPAYDVNNDAEGEYLYPPGQRFKVTQTEPFKNGSRLQLEPTNEQTPVEQRTSGILSRMKPRLANLAGVEPEPGYRMAAFEQRPDGYVQSYADGNPYKLLTQDEADAAIDKLRPNPQWQMSYKNMAYAQ